MFGAHWDLLAQQRARPRAAPPAAAQRHAAGGQEPVDRRRARREHPRPQRAFEHAPLRFVMRQPQRQRRLEALAARLLGRQPDLLEHRPLRFPVTPARPSPPPFLPRHRQLAAQQLDGVLAPVAAQLAQLVEQPASRLAPAPPVAFPHFQDHFPRGVLAHF